MRYGDVEEFEKSVQRVLHDLGVLRPAGGGVERSCRHVLHMQLRHLVLDQTQQRTEHHRQPGRHQRGQLIRQALPPPCRHQHEHVLT